jgi:hypothetical protein
MVPPKTTRSRPSPKSTSAPVPGVVVDAPATPLFTPPLDVVSAETAPVTVFVIVTVSVVAAAVTVLVLAGAVTVSVTVSVSVSVAVVGDVTV